MISSSSRQLRLARPIPLRTQLSPLRRGAGDPTWAEDAAGGIWRATTTPDGVGVERLATDRAAGTVVQEVYGDGRDWLLDRLPALCGELDLGVNEFDPPSVLSEPARSHRGLRVSTTFALVEATVAAILEQKVTGKEAWRAWRSLIRQFGQRTEIGDVVLYAPPTAQEWRKIPSWEWHRAGVDANRSRTIQAAMRVVPDHWDGQDIGAIQQRIRSVSGIGVWTVAEISQRALGDPDAISFGDYHLPNEVAYLFAGRRNGTDDLMADLLEPWRGHRYRVQRLVELSSVRRPRRGPRMTISDMRGF